MQVDTKTKLTIFDHLPKTAGSSLAAWAQAQYGPNNTVWFRNALHNDVINKFAHLKIACGHTYFEYGETLSESCNYVTTVRDPVDRVISWIYFALSYNTPEMEETKRDCLKFLDGCEDDLCDHFVDNITNNYIDHFCKIGGTPHADDDGKLETSIAAINNFSVIGNYNDLSRFKDDVMMLVGSRGPAIKMPHENKTRFRPLLKDVSSNIIKAISKRNELDIELYNHALRKLGKQKKMRKFFFFK